MCLCPHLNCSWDWRKEGCYACRKQGFVMGPFFLDIGLLPWAQHPPAQVTLTAGGSALELFFHVRA